MYIKIENKGKSFWWTLRGANNKTFATSETFVSDKNLHRSANAVANQFGLELKYSNSAKRILRKKGYLV